jgi:hypothetical protein
MESVDILPDLPFFTVEYNADQTLTLHWDENDPRCIEAGFNDMSQEDWIELLMNSIQNSYCLELQELSSRAEQEGPLMPREDRRRLAELQSTLLVNGHL